MGLNIDANRERDLSKKNEFIFFFCSLGSRPLVSLALSAISLKLLFLISEAFIFGSVPTGQHLIFPVVTGVVSACVTIALLFLTTNDSPSSAEEKEDLDYLKKRKQRKNK